MSPLHPKSSPKPSRDETAFLLADIENTGTETLLPGHALLYLDDALVGEADLGAGQTQDIMLQHSLEWPDGFVLQ
jgi:hypothetical protein